MVHLGWQYIEHLAFLIFQENLEMPLLSFSFGVNVSKQN